MVPKKKSIQILSGAIIQNIFLFSTAPRAPTKQAKSIASRTE